jgi:DNA-binding LytR/AlgR family response regulator
MKKVNVLIVEDEALVAADIAFRLEQKGYNITGTASGAKEALAILAQEGTDLCLLDIKLNGATDGVGLAQLINELYTLPLIFLTSQNDEETFTRAKSTRPAAFILKPFNDKELQIAIDLAISNYAVGQVARSAGEQSAVKEDDFFSLKQSIFLRKKDKFERVDFNDILWAEAESNYTSVGTTSNQFLLSITLQEMERHLTAPFFLRIHRSYVVNLQHIDSIEGNMLHIRNRSFQVSKAKRDEVFSRFRIL